MSEPLKIRCEHCFRETRVKAPEQRDEREIIARAQRELLDRLAFGTKDLERIGRRVLQRKLAMQKDRGRGAIQTLAKILNLDKSTVSIAVSKAEAELAELQKANFAPSASKPVANSGI